MNVCKNKFRMCTGKYRCTKSLLDEKGIKSSDIRGVEDLHKLPFKEKHSPKRKFMI